MENISGWREREEKKQAFHAFQSEYIFYLSPAHTRMHTRMHACTQAPFPELRAAFHNDKVDLAPFFPATVLGFCSLSSNCEISPCYFHFPAAVKWLKDTDQPL